MKSLYEDLIKVDLKALNEALEGFTTKTHELLPKIPNRASGSQIRAMLRNAGVTDDEIKYLKLGPVLDKDMVTKQEIMGHLEVSGVPIHVTDYAEKEGPKYQQYSLSGGRNYGEKLVNLSTESKPFPLMWHSVTPGYSNIKKQWNGYHPKADLSGRYNAPDKPLAEIFLEQPDNSEQEYLVARVDDPGQEEYGVKSHWADVFNEPVDNEKQLEDAMERAKKACEERVGEIDHREAEPGKDYTSSHWPRQKNPLFHIRHQEFTDADGKELWLIEEIQSDWHQQGRRKGYKGDFKAEVRHVPSEGETHPYHVYIGNEKISGHKDEAGAKASAAEIEPRWNKNNGVPVGPMKKSWEENAFKYALQQAVKAGADRIGWVTGKISAERYDLRKKIAKIRLFNVKAKHPIAWENNRKDPTSPAMANNGKPYLIIAVDHNDRTIVQKYVDEGDLPDVIGKELASKLMSQPEDNHERTLEGDEMEIGGDGMKAAYDQRIPSIAKKIAKAGGSQVGKVGIPDAMEGKEKEDEHFEADIDIEEVETEDGFEYKLVYTTPDGREIFSGPYETEDEARDQAAELQKKLDKENAPKVEVWYMDITDGVKALVNKGLRLAFETVAPDKWWVI